MFRSGQLSPQTNSGDFALYSPSLSPPPTPAPGSLPSGQSTAGLTSLMRSFVDTRRLQLIVAQVSLSKISIFRVREERSYITSKLSERPAIRSPVLRNELSRKNRGSS
ncbi:hypothetical protein RRG08_004259 [Elysia crispata]|uniref:Uncharacterized protein n=1 Tax=Elysia crispata TaxID=231223 RepID=A0AAE1DP51_9GAST|nr:hypothetical protein RRG08_004259 [Elysia crispata]